MDDQIQASPGKTKTAPPPTNQGLVGWLGTKVGKTLDRIFGSDGPIPTKPLPAPHRDHPNLGKPKPPTLTVVPPSPPVAVAEPGLPLDDETTTDESDVDRPLSPVSADQEKVANLPTESAPTKGLNQKKRPKERKERTPWTLVISDTDNDIETVCLVLWLTGLCDRRGFWNPGIGPVKVVHTGDWLNKFDPDPHALDFFKRLQNTAPPGCSLVLLNGNHELEILKRAEAGEHTPLTPQDLDFIRSQDLIHGDQGVLYVHGYPNCDLLKSLRQFCREGSPLNDFNNLFRKAFYEGSHALFRQNQGLMMVGDIPKPKAYFARINRFGITNGAHVAEMLQELGFDRVIHGHKPCENSLQQDYELKSEIPGIRVINNDNRIKRSGLGGLLINTKGRVSFINPEQMREAGGEKEYRKKLRKILKTRKRDLQKARKEALLTPAAQKMPRLQVVPSRKAA
ncbi:MAG: metallophosphoesterase [Magnetococcales bacterium]|nr:metallophosphoesterase [Magnetococcales bacterium]